MSMPGILFKNAGHFFIVDFLEVQLAPNGSCADKFPGALFLSQRHGYYLFQSCTCRGNSSLVIC